MKVINKLCLQLLLCASPLLGFSQQVEEKLITKDAGDSIFLKAFRSTFDTNGNYYFETLLRENSGKFELNTNKKKYPGVFAGASIATSAYKALVSDAFFADSSKKKIYYKNKNGTRLYGPYPGKIREVLEYGRDNIAMELCIGAKSHLYINDSLVNMIDSSKQQWLCSFSENGNVIYSFYSNGHYKLYLNYKLIDSSTEAFSEIAVNNNKRYVYAKQQKGKFTIHSGKSVFGPFGSVDHADLWNSNAYYFSGCADSQCYVLVDDKVYRFPEAHTNSEDPVSGSIVYKSDELILVEPIDAEHYVFSYNQNNNPNTFLNVNGKVSQFNYPFTSFIYCNKKGGYAFYGSRIDTVTGAERLYRNINGTEKKIPFFKKKDAHRVQYLTVDASGESLYYIETQDSVYLYHNDQLMYKPASRTKFLVWDGSVLPQSHPEGIEYFQGINIDGISYLVYNNTISKPLPMIYPEYDRFAEMKRGTIVAGDISNKGFFVIECTSPGNYLLNINNKEYTELSGIDRIFGEQSYFTDHAIIFYGTKGNAFYQFKVRY